MGGGVDGQAITSLELALKAENPKRKKMSCRYQLLALIFFFPLRIKKETTRLPNNIHTHHGQKRTDFFFFHHSMVRAISPPDVLLGE